MTEEIIQKILDGDRQAYKNLVARFQNQITSVCLDFTKNRETAEDIAQEVFIEVFRSIKSFRREAQLSTWIYRIAITKCIDYTRRQKSKKRFGLVKENLGVEYKSGKSKIKISIPSKWGVVLNSQ